MTHYTTPPASGAAQMREAAAVHDPRDLHVRKAPQVSPRVATILRLAGVDPQSLALGMLRNIIAEVEAPSGPLPSEPHAEQIAAPWRCFHCDEVFTDREAAAAHFGYSECSDPACRVDGGLATAYRELEARWSKCLNECCEHTNAYHAAEDDRRRALVQAEQSGYDKGVAEMGAQCAEQIAALTEAAGALKFYAGHVGNCRKNTSEGDASRRLLDHDCGGKARTALARIDATKGKPGWKSSSPSL